LERYYFFIYIVTILKSGRRLRTILGKKKY